MPYSISTLLIRNFVMSSVKRSRSAGAPPSTRFYTEDCVFYDPRKGVYLPWTKSTASRARSKLLTLNPISANYRPAGSGNGGLVRLVSGRRVGGQLTRNAMTL